MFVAARQWRNAFIGVLVPANLVEPLAIYISVTELWSRKLECSECQYRRHSSQAGSWTPQMSQIQACS